MAYSEIINEIQEQINDISTSITNNTQDILAKQTEIDQLEELISSLQHQLVGLNQLKVNAQTLIDNQNSVDVNLNVNVNSSGNNVVSVSSGSSIAQDGPFR
jgi:chromosome segregation ATPase